MERLALPIYKYGGLINMWLARNKNGVLYLHDKKPIRQGEIFLNPNGRFSMPFGNNAIECEDYSICTWENSPLKLTIGGN